jgi:hypothetical protein
MTREASKAAALLGRLGGRASASATTPELRSERASRAGRASAAKLSPEARRERARKAAAARWGKEKKQCDEP